MLSARVAFEMPLDCPANSGGWFYGDLLCDARSSNTPSYVRWAIPRAIHVGRSDWGGHCFVGRGFCVSAAKRPQRTRPSPTLHALSTPHATSSSSRLFSASPPPPMLHPLSITLQQHAAGLPGLHSPLCSPPPSLCLMSRCSPSWC